jgi:hypothetical protein
MAVNEERFEAWQMAYAMVTPIVEQHGLQTYRNGSPFGPGVTYTPVEQHVEQVTRVADWLLEGRSE